MAHPSVLYTLYCLFHSAGIGILSADEMKIHEHSGETVTIICSYSWASTNIKYFCRDPCKDSKDILVKSDQSPTGRYTLKDSGEGTFTVNITDLQESDSGIYQCGVERYGFDTFTKVKLTKVILTVSKDPSESMTTSTQPYKDIQTSTDSHTITPAAHSESPSVTASKTTRYPSPDDITLSPSITGKSLFLLFTSFSYILKECTLKTQGLQSKT
uniref:Ig-like domain-containing protein n=1 Tax=Cyprinus carpio TaxID=7962 RepID=A0A8C2C6G9_CYPCA